LGFLPFNFPRGQVFLGDAGSHLTGYLIATLPLLPQFYPGNSPRVLIPRALLVVAVPVADLAWVVGWRWWSGKPFYVGDTNHFSHQLVRAGFSRTRAVLLLWS